MKVALVLLSLVVLSFAQPLLNSYCEYNEASLPAAFEHWANSRRSRCSQQTNAIDCEGLGYCWWRDTTNQNALATHQEIFKPPHVYNPVTGVYVAVGYDLGNSILIINNNQAVLIDTVGSYNTGVLVRQAFETAIGGPIPTIVALVYTHSHPDHYGGTKAFTIPVGTPIYAHASFLLNLQKSQLSQGALLPRSAKQFGFYLATFGQDVDGFLGAGIGPYVAYDNTVKTLPPLPNPNGILSSLTATIAGLQFQFYFTAGETDDTITTYIPALGVVSVGDNVYKGFPNLYAIRGTPPRDVRTWYASVDKARSFNAAVLIGSHSPPVGPDAALVSSILTAYRDGIQSIHDQTLALLNQGLYPDDIAAQVKLPPSLIDNPYLQEFYGYIPYCVKSIFTSYLGWFSGNIATLDLPSTAVQSSRLVELAGGPTIAVAKAVAALDEGTLEGAQWALQLADAINRTVARDFCLLPYVTEIYVQAAQIIGYSFKSSNARNYYLATVEEVIAYSDPVAASYIDARKHKARVQGELAAPIEIFMESVPIKLNRDKSDDIIFPVKVVFEEADLEYSVVVRQSIVEVYPTTNPLTEQYDFAMELTFTHSDSFKSIILGLSDVQTELISCHLTSNASTVEEIEYFFDLFAK